MDCPAGVMRADVLTKPLQGRAFRKMRAQLMNCNVEYIVGEEAPAKERKTLLGQSSNQDTTQTVHECVEQYPRSKLGATRVINRAVLCGTNGRRTEMRTK